ncbi:MAG: PilZ domain-containing protein [Thermoanaerobaculia bacterium]|nr:PilZ domain-containing protein [Thermoanaerobaculia bacterium]
MSRRTAERHARRVEVRFWRRGNDQPHSGFTIDLSKTGMFLGTSISLEPGERLRVEIVDRERGFFVEGQVARVHRVSLALRHVEQPGVGVRFLGPGDLVGDLLNAGRSKTPPAARRETAAADPPPPPAAAPAAAPPLSAAAQEAAEALFGPDPNPSASTTPPAAATPAPAPAPAPAPPPPARPARVVPVEFVDRASFLSVYHRDIAAGGLFVATDQPGEMHEVVLVELRLPDAVGRPLQFEARVVHRFDPKSMGKPGLSGMGVQFLDPDRVRAALAPMVAESRA